MVRHAKIGSFELREVEEHGFDWLTVRIQNGQKMHLASIKVCDFEALTIRPRNCGLLIDFDREVVSIELSIRQRWRLFPEGIVDASGDADATLLRKDETGS
jgi:hypothetical protein